ncbi:glycosyltransferase family 39 protein [Streptomyces sp. WAC 01529]|uniref:ArnT family glycosyltransferase n=1 Tax=Streptomyces sp. WAC 01529 TaxID=2203205 RepID=UPI0019D1E1CB|nr:glycosyltransferase family 39 protein [Streptomyces sp. WAC 01529]
MTSLTSTSSRTAPSAAPTPPRRGRFWRSPPDQPRWARPGLLGIAALAALLYAWNITSSGFAPYYSLAARSMSESWKAFLFTTVDPAATLTMDKIGGFLWPQALSARIFGFHDWALTLPQCVMGVISVLVMYRLVRRWQGPAAGLLASGLLTVTPVAASMFGHAMPDGSLTMCLVLAADQYQKAVGTARLRPLLLSALWIGIGFQMKMMEAWIAVPAFFVGYLVAAPAHMKQRLGRLAVAGVVLFSVSLSWVALLTFTPADSRPYVDGSTNNSAAAMVFGYNGFNRVHAGLIDGGAVASGAAHGASASGHGDGGGDGGGNKDGARSAPTAPPASSGPGQPGSGQEKGGAEKGGAGRQPTTAAPSGAPPGGTGGGTDGGAPEEGQQGREGQSEGGQQGRAEGGQQGQQGQQGHPGGTWGPSKPISDASLWLKLLRNPLAPQIGWLYPLAVIALVMGLATYRGSVRTHPARAGFLMWGSWLVTAAFVLSALGDLFHTAYLSILAPPIAALAAAGTVALWRAHRVSPGGRRAWVLPAAITLEVAWTVHLAYDYTDFAPWLIPLVAVATLVAVLALGFPPGNVRRAGIVGLLAGCVAMFAAPTAWSLSVLNERYAGSAFDASAGPRPDSAGTGRLFGRGTSTSLTAAESKLLAYVQKHKGDAEYAMSAETAMGAAPYIYAKVVPVLPVAGMHGDALSLAEYQELVATGDVRFALASEAGAKNSKISAWVRSACAEVDPATYGAEGRAGEGRSPTLYHCAADDAVGAADATDAGKP